MPRAKADTIRIPIQEYQEMKDFLENFVFDLLKKDYINLLNKALDSNQPVVESFIDSKEFFINKVVEEKIMLLNRVVDKVRWEDVDTALKNHVAKYRKEKIELENKYI